MKVIIKPRAQKSITNITFFISKNGYTGFRLSSHKQNKN